MRNIRFFEILNLFVSQLQIHRFCSTFDVMQFCRTDNILSVILLFHFLFPETDRIDAKAICCFFELCRLFIGTDVYNDFVFFRLRQDVPDSEQDSQV